jgi:hypothetical protein
VVAKYKKSQVVSVTSVEVFRRLRASIYASEIALNLRFICQILFGGNREREIPDPIPNSEVKPLIADGTAHKSVEE